MSDRIAVFSEGRIEQVGSPGEIYERPVNEFVASFVGTSNILERAGTRYMVRPERIRLLSDGRHEQGELQGVIREVAYLGSVTRYLVEAGDGETIVVVRQNIDTSAAGVLGERGREVRLSWRAEDASVLDSKTEEAG